MSADIITFANNKGGVLKTTTCVELGGYLARLGKKVLIVDLDSQGNMCLSFGISKDSVENTIFEVLINDIDPKEAIINAYENIDLIIANRRMERFTPYVVLNKDAIEDPYLLLKTKLEPIIDEYDVILVDTPPAANLLMANGLIFADGVIIPFQPEVFSVDGTIYTLKTIGDIRRQYNENLKVIGVLTTLIDKRTKAHKKIIEKMYPYCAAQEGEFFNTYIPRTIAYADHILFNKQPATLGRDRKILKTYKNLYNEIIKRGGLKK